MTPYKQLISFHAEFRKEYTDLQTREKYELIIEYINHIFDRNINNVIKEPLEIMNVFGMQDLKELLIKNVVTRNFKEKFGESLEEQYRETVESDLLAEINRQIDPNAYQRELRASIDSHNIERY